ncbi:MAG: DUF6057 family protein [Prevotellaceae bacterium]|nr:DUF6057 family protein [Prevotellaceae bacterium]MDY3855655.1 DUF6057 family protein [Bacteroidaceae bacterium]
MLKHRTQSRAKHHSVNQSASSAKIQKRRLSLPHIPLLLVAFLLFWLFASVVYRYVFYMAEQNTYFAFDRVAMYDVLSTPGGWLIMAGRFFLLSFHWPLLGGLVLSLLLTIIAWLIDYVFRLRGWWRALSVIPSYAFLAYIVSIQLNLYYELDPGILFYVPLIALAVMTVVTLIVRLVSKRHLRCLFSLNKIENPLVEWGRGLIYLLMFVVLSVFALKTGDSALRTAHMQTLLQQNRYDEMIDVCKGMKHPTRTVCAYYAIALSQTDRILDGMFDIFYQYPNIHLKNKTFTDDFGTNYYAADCNFYSGLITPAYHINMEQCVIGGLNVYRLKYMYLCCLINGEIPLAEKYLRYIEQMPFEGQWVKEYRPMLYNSKLISTDPALAKVIELEPVSDAFEQSFSVPTFIGYNNSMLEGRSERALMNSLASCLYTKNLPGVMDRYGALLQLGQQLPKVVEEAVLLYSIRDPKNVDISKFTPYIVDIFRNFMSQAAQYKGKDAKYKGQMLKNQYLGFYPLYYFYENVPDDNYNETTKVMKLGDRVN